MPRVSPIRRKRSVTCVRCFKRFKELFPRSPKRNKKCRCWLSITSSYSIYRRVSRRRRRRFLTRTLPSLINRQWESLVAHFLTGGQIPPWLIDDSDQLLTTYANQRFHKNGLDVGPLVGAGLVLWIAEQHRKNGNQDRARALINYAVEDYPMLKTLHAFEQGLPAVGDLPKILAADISLSDQKIPDAPAPRPPPEPIVTSVQNEVLTQTSPGEPQNDTSAWWMRLQRLFRSMFRWALSTK